MESESCPEDIKNVGLRLGAFHAQMSFLGAIGHLMSGSGLEEMLQRVYACNSVNHIMSGKAVTRAMRGHHLIETVST